jgi:ABC-type oligopeptide transport system substrate-binding subunit
MAPIAGLATHYEIERDGTRYTFYLRGHRAPRGIRLPGNDSLPAEFTRGRAGGLYEVPARWSDGRPIAADDCVHYWQRYFAPQTGNADAYTYYCVAGAAAVGAGKVPPEGLGVRTLGEFAFQVDLREPAPYFLMLCSRAWITPRHVIEQARLRGNEASWTEIGNIATSGPFVLKEFRAKERTVVSRNANYFDTSLVGIEEVEFSAADGTVVLNLFRAGLADSMEGRVLPLQLAPRMRGQATLQVRPACASHSWRINTQRGPMRNLHLRYALNMATDRESIVRFLGMGQIPAKARVPPLEGYRSPASLPIEINGTMCDVLAFNPRAARELWASAASAEERGPLPIHYAARVDGRLLAEIQQYQWSQHLGLQTNLQAHEPASYVQLAMQQGDFSGVAEDTSAANYPDPFDLLGLYTGDYPNWSDSSYEVKLNAASSILNPERRMKELAECEKELMRAMPFVPLYFDSWVYLERPEVHGLALNPLGVPAFKYGWIDSGRRAQ